MPLLCCCLSTVHVRVVARPCYAQCTKCILLNPEIHSQSSLVYPRWHCQRTFDAHFTAISAAWFCRSALTSVAAAAVAVARIASAAIQQTGKMPTKENQREQQTASSQSECKHYIASNIYTFNLICSVHCARILCTRTWNLCARAVRMQASLIDSNDRVTTTTRQNEEWHWSRPAVYGRDWKIAIYTIQSGLLSFFFFRLFVRLY